MTTPHQDYEYNNKTLYGIKSEVLRFSWAGYFLFVLASSLLGDTSILVSIKYKVFKLHKVVTVTIQHIAVTDLLVSLTDVLPKLISILSNGPIFSAFLCYLSPYLRYYFNILSLLLICAMTSTKLCLLKFPLRSDMIGTKRTHMLCAACWLASFSFPLTFLLVDKQDITFSYRTYKCTYGYTAGVWTKLKPALALLFIYLPTCLVVTNTIFLLHIAKKSARRSLKWQGILTSVLTAVVYCISVLPMVVYYVGGRFLGDDQDRKRSFFYVHYYRIANSVVFLNTVSNFYIYSLTVSSFRRFLRFGLKSSRSSSFSTHSQGTRGRISGRRRTNSSSSVAV
ncbi:hypothetical protein ACHWQZ_G007273 [Mnemiopsis leidyi]